MYLDGANMNAILGQTRPGDFGIDLMHYNPHKTFSGPHGGGGPGAGPDRGAQTARRLSAVAARRQDAKASSPSTTTGRSRSAASAASSATPACSCGRTATSVRYGPDGLKAVSSNAVLNANYLLALVKDFIEVPHGDRCMHEFVASAAKLRKEKNVTPMEIAKRLLDHGFHAPTVYFPLRVVPEAVMIEPTETEIEGDARAVRRGASRHRRAKPAISSAKRRTRCRSAGPNEQMAATQPVLRWKPNA